MKKFGRRRFLGALARSMAFLPLRKILSQGNAMGQGGSGSRGEKPLKAVIVYYSATGSTAKVAKAIYRGMKSSMDCDLLKIKKADPKKMAQYDVVGIGGPIWFFRETGNVKLFISKMPPMDGKLCFPFCSHGSEPIGFFSSIWNSLEKKNFTILGWNDWFGSVYHVLHMPKPYLTDGHPDEKDLADAEAFGREMADRARRYRAGEKGILPEIPQGTGADPLWILHDLPEAQHGPGPKIGSAYGDGAAAQMAGVTAATAKPSAVAAGGMKPPARTAAGAAAPSDGSNPSPGLRRKSYPTIDLAKCTYPRCDACIFGCPVDAIDMSLTVPGDMASSELIIKNACTNCGLCQKLCVYDAVSLGPAGGRTNHAYDMAKCTYPKCTICVDHCPMNSIDFATRPPMIHNNCEGCDLCYCICPRDAISIPNLLQTHARMRFSPDHPFVHEVDRYEAAGRFRRLVPLSEVGFGHPIYLNMNVPRIVLNEDDEATYCDKPCKLQG